MPDFTHLHVHSEYSLLDGLSRLPDLITQAKQQGMPAIALTDHGVMHGAIDFYRAARSAGINPIVGCEVYVAQRSMDSRQPHVDANPYHLTLLAQNEPGYRNLIKLVSRAHLDGFYYKPRIDANLLAEHASGLIALSGCLGAQVPQLILTEQQQEAVKTIGWFRDVFGPERYYLELQDHNLPEQRTINKFLVDYARREGVPLVATNDVHYVQAADAEAQDILLCVQTGTTVNETKRMRMASQEFYLKSPAAMAALFPETPDAIRNTCRVAEMCDLQLQFGRTALPDFAIPAGHTYDSYLRQLTLEGLQRHYPNANSTLRDRVTYELDVICQLGFAQYILIVADFTFWARSQGIMAEPRGSVGGSVVAYLIGICSVDPIRYDLPFERFLSPERREMPDIDLDFPDDRRAEVYEYVKQKYGPDRVAQIITFNSMLGKAAVRDVGRALGMAYADVDRVAKLIPTGVKVTIDQGIAESAELRTLEQADPEVAKLLAMARKVEGLARNASVHAAGVVISREPLIECTPLQRAGHADVVTQYDGTVLPEIGILKMDFLGLANFAILDRAVKLIKATTGDEINLKALPSDDPLTFALLQTGETTGMFQLESPGMRRYIKELKPTSIRDISAMISLYRPGPMDNIPRFIAAKNGKIAAQYMHPDLEPILRESYGVIVYQEQVMDIVIKVAGFSAEQGYKFIKAIAKKNAELLLKQKEPFVAGALARGYTPDLIEDLWRLFEPFQRYSFNKAHTMSYAHVTYQTAYLKAHYPAPYMAAVLCSALGDSGKIAAAITEAERMGVRVEPPSINRSDVNFSVDNGAIRFGLAAIKNVGQAAAEALVTERLASGDFASVENFCGRLDTKSVTKKTLESLIKAGALDCLGSRTHLLQELDRMLGLSQRLQHASAVGQVSMFGGPMAEAPALFKVPPPDQDPTSLKERLAWEKELLGVYLGEHPLVALAAQLGSQVTVALSEVNEEFAGQRATLGGLIASSRTISTKSGQSMLYAELEDLGGSIEVVVFPRLLEQTRDLWADDAIVLVTGKIEQRAERWQLVCDSAQLLGDGASGPARQQLRIAVPQLGDLAASRGKLERVSEALHQHTGDDLVQISISTSQGDVLLATPNLRTSACAALLQRLQLLLGPDTVSVQRLGTPALAVAS